MLIRINPRSPAPLYQQIIDEIKSLIDQGAVCADQALPSTRRLSAKLGVNRSTVVRAYEELHALGYLSSRPGSYHRVQKRRKEVPYNPERKSLISWKKVSSSPANTIYETFLRYFPEGSEQIKNQPDVINISQLDLDHRLYPMAEFKRCMDHVLLETGAQSLEYGDHKGLLTLRQQIARRLRLHGISVSEDEILITNGAQQALDLIIRMLGQTGKKVAVESPTYAAAIPLFEFSNIKIAGIPMKKDGMDLKLLDSTLQKDEVSFVYTIPNFHNPTGITSSHLHRERLLNLCMRQKVPVVEDGFEEDMKYYGRVPLPIKSIDDRNIVIYIGTFSKALFPGLRIGWITADKDCINRLVAIKRFSDL
jgi:GntR family transcriptional regulator/MocR family aminotransferase